jgi:hypothetical protein
MNAQERAARAVLRPRSGQVTVAPIDPPSRTAGEAPGATAAMREAVSANPPGASPAAHDWWTDHDALAELWRWLEDRGQEPNDVAYYLERPWKWTPEYDDMRSEQTALP